MTHVNVKLKYLILHDLCGARVTLGDHSRAESTLEGLPHNCQQEHPTSSLVPSVHAVIWNGQGYSLQRPRREGEGEQKIF